MVAACTKSFAAAVIKALQANLPPFCDMSSTHLPVIPPHEYPPHKSLIECNTNTMSGVPHQPFDIPACSPVARDDAIREVREDPRPQDTLLTLLQEAFTSTCSQNQPNERNVHMMPRLQLQSRVSTAIDPMREPIDIFALPCPRRRGSLCKLKYIGPATGAQYEENSNGVWRLILKEKDEVMITVIQAEHFDEITGECEHGIFWSVPPDGVKLWVPMALLDSVYGHHLDHMITSSTRSYIRTRVTDNHIRFCVTSSSGWVVKLKLSLNGKAQTVAAKRAQ